MKKHNLSISLLIGSLFILLMSISAYAESMDDIRVIKISAQDQRAIIKTTERELRIIKVGDKIQVERSYQRSALPVNPKGLGHGAGSDQPGDGQSRNSYQQENISSQQSAVPVNPNGLGHPVKSERDLDHGTGGAGSSQQEKQSKNNEQRTAFRNQHKIVELKVVEIAEGRVVLEEETEKGKETVIIRLVDGKQTVERITRTPDEQPVFYAPQLDTDKH